MTEALRAELEELARIPRQMGNRTPESILDELGEVRQIAAALEKKRKFLSEHLKNSMSREQLERVDGGLWSATVDQVCQERIISSKVRTVLTNEQLAEVTSVVEYDKLSIAPRVVGVEVEVEDGKGASKCS